MLGGALGTFDHSNRREGALGAFDHSIRREGALGTLIIVLGGRGL